jgi:hypothetical protein
MQILIPAAKITAPGEGVSLKEFWKCTDIYDFENMGFSHNVEEYVLLSL